MTSPESIKKLTAKMSFGETVGTDIKIGELKTVFLRWKFLENGVEIGNVNMRYYPAKKVALIVSLEVGPEFRSTYEDVPKGYGRSILKMVESRLKKEGAVGLLVDGTFSGSYKNNAKIRGWYQRNHWYKWLDGMPQYLYYSGRGVLSASEMKDIDRLVRIGFRGKIREKFAKKYRR